jgi:hypothetical protein
MFSQPEHSSAAVQAWPVRHFDADRLANVRGVPSGPICIV